LFTSHRPPRIDEAEGLEALEYWVRRTGAGLLVVDPLYAAVGGDSLSGGRSARRLLTGLKDVCAATGATVLVLHHLTKDDRRWPGSSTTGRAT
jgi:RecA-family ATPase